MVTTFDSSSEIEDMILEWAAQMFPQNAVNLSVLCRHIQSYVESIMYESLAIASNNNTMGLYIARIERILPTLISRPPLFFAAHVRNLWIRSDVLLDIVCIVLLKCTAIQHLGLTSTEEGYVPMVSPTTHTLISLHIGRHTVEEMAQCGMVFPNLLFLTLHFSPPHMRVPPLNWIPSLKTILLELEHFPLVNHNGWKQDIETILSIATGLQLLVLNASGRAMSVVKEYMKGRNFSKDIKAALSNNLDMELEWRCLFKGKNRF